jgi:stage V sporulation protein AC
MNKDEYKKIVKKLTPKENKSKNSIVAFFVGGLVGALAEGLTTILTHCFALSRVEAGEWTCLVVIFMACLFTALGFFDKWVTKAKAGLIIPTTGFAHSVASAALDYKRDGLVTGVGANIFKLAGSVILYGIVSAFFLSVLGVIIYG